MAYKKKKDWEHVPKEERPRLNSNTYASTVQDVQLLASEMGNDTPAIQNLLQRVIAPEGTSNDEKRRLALRELKGLLLEYDRAVLKRDLAIIKNVELPDDNVKVSNVIRNMLAMLSDLGVLDLGENRSPSELRSIVGNLIEGALEKFTEKEHTAAKAKEKTTKLNKEGKTFDSMTAEEKFEVLLDDADHIVILTGAGISAESGVPTFRGEGGLWRTFKATDLATPQAFAQNPSLIWEFYQYRRDLVSKCLPNKAHYSLCLLETKLNKLSKKYTLITQNVDRLHHAAGSKNILELHGSIWLIQCTQCKVIIEDRTSPLTPALAGKGSPDPNTKSEIIPEDQLPRCKSCGGLLRPGVVWFGEQLDKNIMQQVEDVLEDCDLFIVVGTSAVVQPAASFALLMAQNGIPVVEVNLEPTPITSVCTLTFHEMAGIALPRLLKFSDEELLELNKQTQQLNKSEEEHREKD